MATLTRFNLIVAIDANGGISKDGIMPWHNRADMKFFRDMTRGNRKNAVVMGRKTYESIPPEHRPLQDRHCVVISRTWQQQDHQAITIQPSLAEALAQLGGNRRYETVWVTGGERVYSEIVADYLYLCDRMYVTQFKGDYNCDQYFPWDQVKDLPQGESPTKTRDYIRYHFQPKQTHPEYQYLQLLSQIMEEGEKCADRTGVGTTCLTGRWMEFDISERLPFLTTKKLLYGSVIKELLWMLSGSTDSKVLEEQGVNIWKGNSTRAFLLQQGLEYKEGDIGPGYGFQWRHWGAEYRGCHQDYSGQGIDQINLLIGGLRITPHSRRHMLASWNVAQVGQMALPPCHFSAQWKVSGDGQYLDCVLYQRSGDMFLGVPFNIASYSLLTYMIAHVCGLRPRKLVHFIGDAHIYNNHFHQVKKQLNRTPRPWPQLRFVDGDQIQNMEDFREEHFRIIGYTSWPHIQAPMAI